MGSSRESTSEHFQNLGSKPCMKVWRIEKKQIVLQKKGNLGTFYAGDCYIVLNVRKIKDNITTDLHLWIGTEVDKKDETNAIEQTCEADRVMDGVTLYRQVQNHETREFLDLFPRGVKYLQGAATKYVHFQQGQYVKRLFQVKGKRIVRVSQVPLEAASLNEGDSFLLDDEWTIFCWNGKDSSKIERAKAIEVARMIRDDFCFGRADIIIADQGVDKKEERMFFQALGGRGDIQPKIEDDDEDETAMSPTQVKVFRVTDESGEMEFIQLDSNNLQKDILNTKDCFILDGGKCGLYVWTGAQCTKEEKKEAFKHALSFGDAYGYSKFTPLTRIMEGNETNHFKSFFKKWPEKRFVTENGHVRMIEKDHSNLFEQSNASILQDMFDEGLGQIKIWRVEGFYKVSWPHELYGVFYQTDTYLIRYESPTIYNHYIIYIWEGSCSSEEHRTNARHLAQKLDVSLRANTTQIQVPYGKEPDHFLCLFKGKLQILTEESKNEYINKISEEGNDEEDEKENKFFKISGKTVLTTKAIQLPLQASLLEPEHIFLLQTEGKSFVWKGSLTTEEEEESALVAADRISPDGDLILFKEGYETHEFWTLLNGRANYNKTKTQVANTTTPRMFLCSNSSGSFKVNEVLPYDQMDLNGDDVILMDAGDEIYLWIGSGANSTEKKNAWDSAMEFVERSGRKAEDVCIVHIKQGLETNAFASLFSSWDEQKTAEYINYAALKREVNDENQNKSKEKSIKKRSSTWGEQRVLKRATTTPR